MEKNDVAVQNEPKSKPRALLEVLAVSTKLGLTSFGGPIVSFFPVLPAVKSESGLVSFAPVCLAG